MKTDNKKILRYIIINISITSIIVFLIWFLASLGRRGILFYVLFIFYMPSFLILSLFKGVVETMHFTPSETFLLVSFIFYSSVIALIQVIIYKCVSKNKNGTVLLNERR